MRTGATCSDAALEIEKQNVCVTFDFPRHNQYKIMLDIFVKQSYYRVSALHFNALRFNAAKHTQEFTQLFRKEGKKCYSKFCYSLFSLDLCSA